MMERKLINNCKYNLKYEYYIQDDGQVYSGITKKILSTQLDKDGYVKVRLIDIEGKRHRFSIHRLVMENFCPIENMDKLQVNHIDGNKQNNNISNLEWVTCEENIHHAVENNLRAKINGGAKLTPEQVIEIYKRSHNNETNIALGIEFGIHPDNIGKIKNKKAWKNILNDID